MTHYMQHRRGKEIADLTALGHAFVVVDDGTEDLGVPRGMYVRRAASVALDGLRRTAPVDLSAFLEQRITLPPGHGYRGSRKFDFDLYPHMRTILSWVDNPDVRQITMCICAQGGKTDTLSAVAGYLTGHRNKNGLYILPTIKMVQKVPRTRFVPLLNNSQVGFMVAENYHTLYRFNNGNFFYIGLASSADSAAEQTATGWVIIDELDEYYPAKHDIVSLARRRMTTVARELMIIACTPKRLDPGYTYSMFARSRRYELELQCPHCSEWFLPDFETHFRWPDEPHQIIKANHLAYLECPRCTSPITDAHHFDLITTRTRWACLDPHLPMMEVGARVPVYMTVAKTFSDVVAEYLASADDPLARADFWNSCIARPRRPDNLVDPALIEYKSLLGDWSQERLEIPESVVYLTAGVDCGANELWLAVLGWGLDGQKYVLRTEQIMRGVGHAGWHEATEQLLALTEPGNYSTRNSFLPPFDSGIIDSGDGNDSFLIYEFCRTNPQWRPAKGVGNQSKLYDFSQADPRNRHRGKYRGLQLITHATHQMQDLLHTSLQTAPGMPGSILFAADAPAIVFSHIKNQIRVPVIIDRKETYRWQKIGSRPDHLRDAIICAMLAGIIDGLDKITPPVPPSEISPAEAPLEASEKNTPAAYNDYSDFTYSSTRL